MKELETREMIIKRNKNFLNKLIKLNVEEIERVKETEIYFTKAGKRVTFHLEITSLIRFINQDIEKLNQRGFHYKTIEEKR